MEVIMKGFLVLLLIVFAISGCKDSTLSVEIDELSRDVIDISPEYLNSSDDGYSRPVRSIRVRGIEELAEIRKIAEMNEEMFLDYLEQVDYFFYGIRSYQEMIAFLNAFDSLQIPLPDDKELHLSQINYVIEANSFSHISFYNDNGCFYSFSVRDFRPTTVADSIQELYDEQPILLYQSEDGNMKIYDYPQRLRRSTINENVRFDFIMDFYGYFMFGSYYDDIDNYLVRDMSDFDAKLLGDMLTLGSLRELEARQVSDVVLPDVEERSYEAEQVEIESLTENALDDIIIESEQ
jgi:hypothetical protein